jgi:hypothetical protein
LNTAFSNYIQDVAENNENVIPEIWSPELWRADSKTGKMKKRQLDNENKSPEQELSPSVNETETPSYTLPPSALLPVEEEESDTEENNSILFS